MAVDCKDIRAQLKAGAPCDGPEHAAHLAACAACRELVDAGELAQLLDAADVSDAGFDQQQMFQDLKTRLRDEGKAGGWLKGRPTWLRRAMVLTFSLGIILAALVFERRPDFDVYPPERMWLNVGTLLAIAAMSLVIGFRPIFRPPLPGWVTRGLVGAGVLAALLFAALPISYTPPPELVSAPPPGLAPMLGIPCLLMGVAVAVPVYLVARLLDRGGSPFSVVLAGLAAGVTGNLVLQLHCPSAHAMHLVCGHFGVLALLLIGASLMFFVERRVET